MEIRNPSTSAPYRSSALAETFEIIKARSEQTFLKVKFFGYSHTMDDYEGRKLRIFNQINFFQILSGVLIPLLGIMLPGRIPAQAWLTVCLPAGVSILVLTLNSFRQYKPALLTYFFLYPLCTCFIYLNGINPGIDLYFILFVILSVFFLQDVGFMLFAIGFSMISFFVLSVLIKHFIYEVEGENPAIYLINKTVSLAFIIYGVFLIKKEAATYQFNILTKQKRLSAKNLAIQKQKEEISVKAALLQKQKEELAEVNAFKNKLFSIISHDLKSPMYALRNLFQNMQQYNLPAEEIKQMVPDVLTDLNYTTSLMENLLQWAKSQMQNDAVHAQEVNLSDLVIDVVKLLRLQVENKEISINVEIKDDVFVYADKDMIHLVLRNLLSNAIKFTPAEGHIEIGLNDFSQFTEVYVQDSGLGISEEGLKKIKQKIFYTTTGTSSETGTGLGLMLCNEFLAKNGSQLQIESTEGNGSTFSFTLPKQAAHKVSVELNELQ